MKISVIFDNLGPYHMARLAALAELCELTAIELLANSADYPWGPVAPASFNRVTLGANDGSIIARALSDAAPDVVFIPGWSSAAALAALGWCRRSGVAAVLMSDSQEIDAPRRFTVEALKRKILRNFQAALVAGTSQAAYAIKLGMTADKILTGYDVVDNAHFSHGAELARAAEAQMRGRLNLPARYFIASARFIRKKNLQFLLRAYADYQRRQTNTVPWALVLLGDGPLRSEVEREIEALGLGTTTILPGFRHYEELPGYLGLASAFVLASTSDQWGLVVNEAMAAGLPVLVSNRCGCAADLVVEGQTGMTFAPDDQAALANAFLQVAAMPEAARAAMGAAGRAHIDGFSIEVFARNALEIAQRAVGAKQLAYPWLHGRVILPMLAWMRRGVR